jgi:hypothetical protein
MSNLNKKQVSITHNTVRLLVDVVAVSAAVGAIGLVVNGIRKGTIDVGVDVSGLMAGVYSKAAMTTAAAVASYAALSATNKLDQALFEGANHSVKQRLITTGCATVGYAIELNLEKLLFSQEWVKEASVVFPTV